MGDDYNAKVAHQLQGASDTLTPYLGLRTNLQGQKRRAEQEVVRLAELLELLDSNPQIERILELLGHGKF